MINDKADEVTKDFFSIISFQVSSWVGNIMEGSDFVFDCVHLLYHKCHKTSFKQGGSYVDSPDCIKSNKSYNKSHQ